MMNQMMNQKFLNQYQQTSVETGMENATPHKLVTLLYEGVLDNLALCKGAIQRKDYQQKTEKLNKALMIITSLRSNLDLEMGGEVAENFQNLYVYMERRLVEASAKNEIEMIEEVSDLIRTLKDAWLAMPDNFKNASKKQIETIQGLKKE